ncbi:S-layer homology domain-containing protein [Pseudalkalibacillus sp. SCS-8]|uniref:S-layer homology domain-containing protein n=1 Tax=Pseudalkalibacillus nanhaiensis TaxID=3115291 RepID=UPI0032D9B5BB
MKKFLSFFMVFALVLSFVNHNQVSAHSHFSDLGKVPWAKEHIYYLSDLGIINGYGDGRFGPNDNITRAQAALMLVKALYPGENASKNPGFKDLSKNNFYYNAIAVAAEKGLITGYPDNTFRPSANITRAETAVLIDRAYKIARKGSATGFTDLASVPWALESILDLSSANIINGYTDGTFKPKNNITRAEFSVVLARTINEDFRPMSDLLVHFIDVGQGDSILIQSPSGKTILIDGGRKSAGQKVVDYLKQAGVSSIDLMVATHPDADHIGGLIDVLEQMKVHKVLDSGKSHTTNTYMEYLNLIDQKNIPFDVPNEGSKINFDNILVIKVLNAFNNSSDRNESSLVLKVSYNDVDFLLTGDASTENEANMMNKYNVEAEILKLGHHGSSTSTSQAFINAVKPEVGILSYGDNSYGHPDSDVVNRMWNYGATLYSTCDAGTITVASDGVNYKVDADPFQGADSCGTNVNPEPKPEPKPTTGKLDITSLSLSDEYVTIKNIDTKDIPMDGWTLVSVEGNQTYEFPSDFVLKKGATVKIVAGRGAVANPPTVLLWSKAYIWNNSGDAARLYDPQGKLIDELSK